MWIFVIYPIRSFGWEKVPLIKDDGKHGPKINVSDICVSNLSIRKLTLKRKAWHNVANIHNCKLAIRRLIEELFPTKDGEKTESKGKKNEEKTTQRIMLSLHPGSSLIIGGLYI